MGRFTGSREGEAGTKGGQESLPASVVVGKLLKVNEFLPKSRLI